MLKSSGLKQAMPNKKLSIFFLVVLLFAIVFFANFKNNLGTVGKAHAAVSGCPSGYTYCGGEDSKAVCCNDKSQGCHTLANDYGACIFKDCQYKCPSNPSDHESPDCCKQGEICSAQSVMGYSMYYCSQGRCSSGQVNCGSLTPPICCDQSYQECRFIGKFGIGTWKCVQQSCPSGQLTCPSDSDVNLKGHVACCNPTTEKCGKQPSGYGYCLPRVS